MSSSERHKARELVRKFAAKSAGGVFAHLKRSDIAAGLLKRLDDPGLIRQGASSLCGPAALLFNYASQRPVEYVRFVTLLNAPLAKSRLACHDGRVDPPGCLPTPIKSVLW